MLKLRGGHLHLYALAASSVILLTGCALLRGNPSTTAPAALPSVAATPTVPPPRILTICLGEEPNTLYRLADPNAAARSVLAAIDDGPIDTISYGYQPVILQKIPAVGDGDVQILSASVHAGSVLLDADGNATTLATGTRVRPSGCRGDDCIITYDGVSPLQVDQMNVTFRLRSDLTWSDGTPLNADDSVYAYSLAVETKPANFKFLLDRTQAYEAADPSSTQWWGIPGYLDPAFATNFWPPAPKHAWSAYTAAELPQIDLAWRSPIGWGPYTMQEWIKGDRMTLAKNPYYFRAAEGYPKFEQLVFRFLSDPNTAISELTAGRCDILDPSVRLEGNTALLRQLEQAGEARLSISPGMAIEWLGLGIAPAAYDDGINLAKGERPDMLGDPRAREALALCLDRQKVIDTVLFGQSSVPLAFVPTDHPLYTGNLPAHKFDPVAGIKLLEDVGWRDLDGKPSTPRVAAMVKNVPAGTVLMLNYYSTGTLQRRQAEEILSQSLAQCGVGIKAVTFSQNDLYGPGPQGPLFGRSFDMIQYAMATQDVQPACSWFTSQEIPKSSNHWIGTNVTGFASPEYDAACHRANLSLPGEGGSAEAFAQTQAIFAANLPAIPLYYRVRVAAMAADVCHFDLDPSAEPMWNVEAFDKGPSCQS